MAQERLQKIIAECGVASRRKAEELIAGGFVKVNGRVAAIGAKADPRADVITVHGKKLERADEPIYLMLHKPRGYVTTMEDEKGRKCVASLVESVGARLYPVGRLDRESEGLLFMTNDGAFANAMMHPSAHVDKRYRVTVRRRLEDADLLPLREGMLLPDDPRKTLPAGAQIVTAEENRTVLEITLREGRNRQIRRMCEQLGWEVIRLRRVAIGSVKLGMLPVGQYRALTPKEVKELVQAAAVPQKVAAAYIKSGKRNGGVPLCQGRSRR